MDKPKYIKIEDLKPYYLYEIIARNANYGIWIPKRQSFAISRVKFGQNFIFEELHWDCPAFATARPIKELEQSPFKEYDLDMISNDKFIKYPDEKKLLEYLNKFEGDRYDENNRRRL